MSVFTFGGFHGDRIRNASIDNQSVNAMILEGTAQQAPEDLRMTLALIEHN